MKIITEIYDKKKIPVVKNTKFEPQKNLKTNRETRTCVIGTYSENLKSKQPILIKTNNIKKNLIAKKDVLKFKNRLRQLPVNERTLMMANKCVNGQSKFSVPKRNRERRSSRSQDHTVLNKKLLMKLNRRSGHQTSINNVNLSTDYQLRNRMKHIPVVGSSDKLQKSLAKCSVSHKDSLLQLDRKKSIIKHSSSSKCKTEIEAISEKTNITKTVKLESPKKLHISDNLIEDPTKGCNNKQEKCLVGDVLESIDHSLTVNNPGNKIEICDTKTVKSNCNIENSLTAIVKNELCRPEKDLINNKEIDAKVFIQPDKSRGGYKKKIDVKLENKPLFKLENHIEIDKVKNTENEICKRMTLKKSKIINQSKKLLATDIKNKDVLKEKSKLNTAEISGNFCKSVNRHTSTKSNLNASTSNKNGFKNTRKSSRNITLKKAVSLGVTKKSNMKNSLKNKFKVSKSKHQINQLNCTNKVQTAKHSGVADKTQQNLQDEPQKNTKINHKIRADKSDSEVNESTVKASESCKTTVDLNNLTTQPALCNFKEEISVQNVSVVNKSLSENQNYGIVKKNDNCDNKLQGKGKNTLKSQTVIEKLVEEFNKTAKITDDPSCTLKSVSSEISVMNTIKTYEHVNMNENNAVELFIKNDGDLPISETNVKTSDCYVNDEGIETFNNSEVNKCIDLIDKTKTEHADKIQPDKLVEDVIIKLNNGLKLPLDNPIDCNNSNPPLIEQSQFMINEGMQSIFNQLAATSLLKSSEEGYEKICSRSANVKDNEIINTSDVTDNIIENEFLNENCIHTVQEQTRCEHDINESPVGSLDEQTDNNKHISLNEEMHINHKENTSIKEPILVKEKTIKCHIESLNSEMPCISNIENDVIKNSTNTDSESKATDSNQTDNNEELVDEQNDSLSTKYTQQQVNSDLCEESLKQQECRVSLENIINSKIDLILTKESQKALEKAKSKALGILERDNRYNEIRAKKYTKRRTKQDVTLEEPRAQRPSRKTKEAAAIYMEILGHKLVEDDIDDDNISIDSFPELPNVRKMEQRENELKAKAKSGSNKNAFVLEASNNTDKNKIISHVSDHNDKIGDVEKIQIEELHKNAINIENLPVKDNTLINSDISVISKIEKTETIGITKRPIRSAAQTKPFIDFSFSDSDESFYDEKRTATKTLKTKSARNRNCDKLKLNMNRNSSDCNKSVENVIDKKAIIKLEDNKKLKECKKTLSKSTKTQKPDKSYTKTSESDSFSDMDEEPLSKLAQIKSKCVETEESKSESMVNKDLSNKEIKQSFTAKGMEVTQSTSVTVNNQTIVVFEVGNTTEKKSVQNPLSEMSSKPKRECTRLPQNYLPLPSSSDEDEDAYIYKTEKNNSTKSLKTADLVCKDLDKRFGKGKVNMSTEQIEKWLKESELAGETICKENDDILKYTETSINLSLEVTKEHQIKKIKKPSTVKSYKSAEACDSDYVKSENQVQSMQLISKQCERKSIFRKERNLSTPNINAFSANNESSVYAFEADNEDSISTPFRRPSRRPSSTATSKSEDSSKYEEYNKNTGHFRVPSVIKPDYVKTISKQEVPVTASTSLAISELEEPETMSSFTTEEIKRTVPMQSVQTKQSMTGLNPVYQNPILSTKSCSSRLSDNNSSMDPPPTTFQRTRCNESKSYLRARAYDRMSENSEDFKYKIPSSPSASSSSSIAKVTKKTSGMKTRIRPIEICTPVVVSDFPPNQNPALVFEAPLFHPNEKEFQDPLEYIERIRPQAEQFGICRIVPPSTFKPECKLSDEMRFTAYNQYVHKMLHRWGPNFKEFMAITNYLKTQNIALKHPPWIGGVEIDLPRLYQIVQSIGGLKEVIEKKKWPKVAELMKIPKCAQDRLTKLDDIYCKYLLPYDTLSPDEKEKLFDEVETEWAKRESRALHKAQQNINNWDSSPNSCESDSDNEIEECIVKGRSMALNGFYRIARNTMSMWFKIMEPAAEEVEQEFWKQVTHKQNHICVHSGSIDSGSNGYGFAVSKNSPFARHAWNLKVLTNNAASILRSLGPVMGVTVPTIHVGMVFSACCWYRDPHSLPWIEYLHTGGSKIWYGVPDSMSTSFHSTLSKLVPNYCRDKSIWLPSDTVMVPPSILVENGVSVSRTIQEPGQFVVVFPKAFTSCICTGYVVSESVYFAPMSWLSTANKVFEELEKSCEPAMFSLERLVISIALDQRSSVDVMKQAIHYIHSLIESEQSIIKQLNELGLTDAEKLPIPDVTIKKKKRFQEDTGNYECEVCSRNIFISWVSELDDSAIYCLKHARDYIETKKIKLKSCKLYYTYNKEDLLGLIEKMKLNIEAKLQKKLIGKSAVATQW